jgi:hypothetical protein
MITQISLTAWIVCTASYIYESYMDQMRIAGKSIQQHHVLSGSFGSKRVLPVRLTVFSIVHTARLARESCNNRWIGRYFPFQAVLISCREERKQSLLRGRRC